VAVTIEVQAPLFVFRQWHRHRTQAYNELSLRYKELPGELFYVPALDIIGAQSTDNKQGRSLAEHAIDRSAEQAEVARFHDSALALYHGLLRSGWPRELARGVLPLNTYSRMFATASLLNWLRFLGLREDSHAQYEIRVYAEALAMLLGAVVPETMALYREAKAAA
jgi:thymidylate synthase (FAD)